jgi:hypothetical protein
MRIIIELYAIIRINLCLFSNNKNPEGMNSSVKSFISSSDKLKMLKIKADGFPINKGPDVVKILL